MRCRRCSTTLAADPDVRVLVLTGAGGTFCAGADISTLQGSPEEAQRLAVLAEEALAAFPKPTLAPYAGTAWAAGRSSRRPAICGSPTRGRCSGSLRRSWASSTRRPPRGGWWPWWVRRRAKYLLFSGELIDTERALRTGLVDEVLPGGELDKRVAEFTRVLASRSRLTQAAAKEFADGRTDRDAHWAEQARESGDAAEGVAAFLERRPPDFTWTRGPARRLRHAEPAAGAQQFDQVRGRLVRGAGVVGRLRVVLRRELYGLGVLVARDPAEQGEAHVDAGGDPGGR